MASADPFDAPVLMGRGRVRKIPEALKSAIVSEAGKADFGRSNSHVAKIVNRLCKSSGGIGDSTAQKWTENAMAQYLVCSQDLCQETWSRVVSFAWDATTLSFMEVVFCALYVSNTAFWAPPVAPSCYLSK